MSFWSDVIATGSGVVDYRLMVEGWPHEWVTNPRITHGDNRNERVVYPGLQYTGLKISERIVLRDAWPQVSNMTITLCPTDSNEDTLNSFTRDVNQSATLTATLSNSDVTWSTFPVDMPPGIYHAGTEAIFCDGDNNIVRGYWNTGAQIHATTIANTNNTVPIYTWPPTMEGRRAYLYAYGTSDDVAGDGTVIWRGTVARPPKMAKDGVTWTIELMPITSVFDQNVGGNDQIEYRIRGVYHSSEAPMTYYFRVDSTSYPSTGGGIARVRGFYETNSDWVAAVNDSLATEVAAAASDLSELVYTIADGVPFFRGQITDNDTYFSVTVKDVVDGDTTIGSPAYLNGEPGHNGDTIDPGGSYAIYGGDSSGKYFIWASTLMPPYEYPLPTSRAFLGPAVLAFSGTVGSGIAGLALLTANYTDSSDTTWPSNRVYMSSVEGLEVGDRLLVKDTGDEEHTPTILQIASINDDPAERYIELDMSHNGSFYLSGDMVMVKITSYATSSNWAGFMQSVVDESPKANIGVTPWITASDVNVSAWAALWTIYPFHDYWRTRTYRFVKPAKVKDVLVPEFQATGWMARLGLDGRLDVSPMPLVSPQRTADATLTDDEILFPANGMCGEWPTWEAQKDGLVNIAFLRLGYSPYFDDFDARFDFLVRMTASISEHKSGDRAKQEIAPKSTPSMGGSLRQRLARLPSATDIAGMLSGYLQTQSKDYAIVTVSVPFTKFYVLCGDIVSVTSAVIPDGQGRRGVSGKKAICVGRDWQLDPATNQMGSLTLYFPRDGGRTAGYAPTGRVTSRVNTTGDVWVLTFDAANFYNLAWSEDSDGDIVKHFEVGDAIELLEVDVNAESRVVGVITDKPSATTIEVTLGGTWTPGGSTWNFRFATGEGGPFDTNGGRMFVYCWIADSDGSLLDGTAARGFV